MRPYLLAVMTAAAMAVGNGTSQAGQHDWQRYRSSSWSPWLHGIVDLLSAHARDRGHDDVHGRHEALARSNNRGFDVRGTSYARSSFAQSPYFGGARFGNSHRPDRYFSSDSRLRDHERPHDIRPPVVPPVVPPVEKHTIPPSVHERFKPGDFVDCEVPLYHRIRVKDRHNIAPCAVPKTIAIRDPAICGHACRCCEPRCVFVTIYVPPYACERVRVKKHGREVKFDYGKYEVEVEIEDGCIEIDYDD